jgi:hypothetical protein
MVWTRKLCPVLLFFGSLLLFVCTLAPTVTFVDSGELIVTAKYLGVAHPPGFPLYLLIAHLATRVPFGNVAQRVNFISAICAAAAAVLVFLVTTEAIRSQQLQAAKQSRAKGWPQAKRVPLPEQYAWIPGLAAGALAAFSRTLWSYATVAEVYALNALLILSVFLLVLRWRNQVAGREVVVERSGRNAKNRNADKGVQTQSDTVAGTVDKDGNRLLYLAAFVFGLALGVHHVTVALTMPAIAWLAYTVKGTKLFRVRHLALAALACLIGLAIYAYLPWAAVHSPALNWGNPDTLERFWRHVTGSQYQSNFSLSSEQVQRQIASFFTLLFREFGWPWLPAALTLGGIGVYSLYRRDRALLAFLILIGVCNMLFTMGYDIAEDKDAYAIPIFLAVVLAAGIGVHSVLASSEPQKRALSAAILLLIPAIAFAANVRINNRSDYHVAEDYVQNIFRSISPGGLLLTADWQVASPMLYFQEIERQRPDVTCIDVLLLRRSWYFEHLESKYPTLMRQTRGEVRLFMEDLLRWEKDPEAYRRDPQLTQRIDRRFCAMVSAFVKNHLATGPAYSTSDVVLTAGGENETVAKSLLQSYQIVPQGLVFQLYADRGFHQTELPQLNMRGLLRRSPAVDEDPVVRQKVLPAYATMLVNCGRAFDAHGENARATEAYRQAWAIDSAFVLDRNLLPPEVLRNVAH